MVGIHVPENPGGDLRVVPESVYLATIEKFMLKKSQAGEPKLVCRFILASEAQGAHDQDYVSTVGEFVLQDYSLQSHALFNLNTLYKTVTKEKLPQGDYDEQEFCDLMNNNLGGSEVGVEVYTDDYTGQERSKVKSVMAVSRELRDKLMGLSTKTTKGKSKSKAAPLRDDDIPF